MHLATDDRAERFAGHFPAAEVHPIRSATLGSNPAGAAARVLDDLARRAAGVRHASARIKPAAVVGFGGYPTLPPLYAATLRGVPTLIHEQNAVMGRANRPLAAASMRIASGFLPDGCERRGAKTVTTGNPVRPAVLEAAKTPYAARPATRRSAFWCSAAVRARSSSPMPSRRPSRFCPRRNASGW